MKSFKFFAILIVTALFIACQDDLVQQNQVLDLPAKSITCPDNGIRIAILSDIHVMEPSLLVKDGPAFQAYLAKDPKLLQYSSKLFQAAIWKIIAQDPDLVLIPGDLTKDGEIMSHELVARMLRQFTLHGIKVAVTIGNHDVNNPEAVRYLYSRTIPVPTVQVNKIRSLYAKFGFNNAISRDLNSLSYVCEPIRNLRIICIDANEYYKNTSKSTTEGLIKPQTLTWIKEQLSQAQSEGKTVIGMMHHGLIEHFAGQNLIDPGYVVANSDSAVNELVNAGMKIILTGHYHATDITKKEVNGKFLYDVETGSTVNYPCTYRMLTIQDSKYHFEPQNTTELMRPGFDTFAKTFMCTQLDGYFYYLLTNVYHLDANVYPVQDFASWFRDAAMAHFAGNETPDMALLASHMVTLGAISPQLANALGSLWMDINTPDNDVTIDMETGNTE